MMTCEIEPKVDRALLVSSQVQRFGRRDQDVGRGPDHSLAISGRCIPGPDADGEEGQRGARNLGSPRNSVERDAEVPVDVVVKRFERRDVEDPDALGPPRDPPEMVQAGQERRQGLPRPGRREQEGVPTGGYLGPSPTLRGRGHAERGPEPSCDRAARADPARRRGSASGRPHPYVGHRSDARGRHFCKRPGPLTSRIGADRVGAGCEWGRGERLTRRSGRFGEFPVDQPPEDLADAFVPIFGESEQGGCTIGGQQQAYFDNVIERLCTVGVRGCFAAHHRGDRGCGFIGLPGHSSLVWSGTENSPLKQLAGQVKIAIERWPPPGSPGRRSSGPRR